MPVRELSVVGCLGVSRSVGAGGCVVVLGWINTWVLEEENEC